MGGHEADVVVVGAGAAGCVVARRLADAGRSVELLEAGPDLRVDPPADLHDGWRLPKTIDWGYTAEPDGSGEPRTLRRVKGVGGTSWMTRFALRGSRRDFDRWAAAGNEGWAFEDVLPIFRAIEADADVGDRDGHGATGPIPISRYPDEPLTGLHAGAVEAAQRVGFAWDDDLNAPDTADGPRIGRLPMNTTAGRRVTTADGYLGAGGLPDRLVVRSDAEVAAIELDGDRAVAVRLVGDEVVRGSTIVLASGTYGSPAILLRSGIGPAAHLAEIGIRTTVDLPGVGSNLADHPAVDIDAGFEGSSRATPLLHTAAPFRSEGLAPDEPPDLLLWMVDPMGEPPSFDVEVLLMRPRSRGQVRLRSADPSAAPVIRLPGLEARSDVRRLAEGLRRAWTVANDPAVRRHCANPTTSLPSTDAELEAFVLANAYSVPHVVGTCAMGTDPAAGAVVDATGRVHGVEGLYIADASIMPEAPSGFPHLVTIMLAEAIAGRLLRA